jgi:hypothetical protein
LLGVDASRLAFLRRGFTTAVFRDVGKIPVCKEVLII